MQASELFDDVKLIFGDKNGVQIEDTDLIRWINDAQLEVARRTACLSVVDPTAVTAGDYDHALAADFLKFISVKWDGNPLLRSTSAEMDTIFAGHAVTPIVTGAPNRYYFRSKTIFLYPSPDVAGTLEITYAARPTLITDATDELTIPHEYQHLLKEYMLSKAYELDENFNQASVKEASFEKKINSASSDERTPEEETYGSVRVLPDDAW